jgi:c-di-AMP phosphodiesterase-like protein
VGENFPTLSIGVGRMGETLGECEEYALQALEMAQSRG